MSFPSARPRAFHRKIGIFIALVLLSFAGEAQQSPNVARTNPQPDVAAEVLSAMNAIRLSVRTNDRGAWERLVSADCEFIEPSGRVAPRSWHAPDGASKASGDSTPARGAEVNISEIQVRIYGESAVLVYRGDLSSQVGDQHITTRTRFTEVYRRTDGRWQMVFSAETPILEKMPAIIDKRIYDDYVGDYQMAPQLISKVYRDGDKLMLIGTGWKQAYELLPLGHDAFYVREMPNNEIVFIRDEQGRVVAQGPAAGSQGPTGKKLAPPAK